MDHLEAEATILPFFKCKLRKPSLIKARRATELASTTDLFFFLPVGMMFTSTAKFS